MASRLFRHRSIYPNHYDLLQQCPTTGTEICKTSFREHQVRNFLTSNSTADEFKVKEMTISGRKYFALEARENGGDLGIYLFGDLPCPDQCIPPEKDLRNPILSRSHIQQVIDTTHCLWLQVHRSGVIINDVFEGDLDNVYSNLTIYAVTNNGQGGLTNQWDTEDLMFTTE